MHMQMLDMYCTIYMQEVPVVKEKHKQIWANIVTTVDPFLLDGISFLSIQINGLLPLTDANFVSRLPIAPLPSDSGGK